MPSNAPSLFIRGHYRLQSDLDALTRVHTARAPEAVAFYAGRILEVLAAQALDDLGLSPHQTVLANLDVLEQYSLLPAATRHAAHGLRRLANDARHILRPIADADATFALIFAQHALLWYFQQYAFGPRMAVPQALAGGCDLTPAVTIDHPATSLQDLLTDCHLAGKAAEILTLLDAPVRSPILAAILTEAFLNAGRLPEAGAALTRGLAEFPRDNRLLLLKGLHESRSGKLPEALAILEPLFDKYSSDPEAAGILAGAYKRLWQQTGEPRWLARSFETYHAGWLAARQTSDYLGVNSATTALLLGRREISAALASTIRTRTAARITRLAARIPDPLAAMEYWSGATLAELELLAGDLDAARATYARLFSLHAGNPGMIDVTRKQSALILQALGKPLFQEFPTQS